MEKHELNIMPDMAEDDFKSLKQDIQTNGFDSEKPVYLYEGKILDGWQRYSACKEIGIEPGFKNFEGTKIEALNFVIRCETRRHLSGNQKAVMAVSSNEVFQTIKDEAERERRTKQAEAIKGNQYASKNVSRKKFRQTNEPKAPPKEAKETRQRVAEMFGTNAKYIDKANKIKNEDPEYLEQIANGKKTFSDWDKKQKKEELEKKKQEYKQQLKEPNMPNKSYRIILADPPWSYNDKCISGGVQDGGVEIRHYDTMTIKDLCNMELPKIDDNAILFLWVTSPFLEDSFKIVNAWGFNYKSSFVWDKIKHNMGHYNSVRHEFLLICTKGSCTPDNVKLFDSVQSIEKTDHSRKPEIFRNIIDTLYPYGNRIELFARTKIKNWEVWGNEV